MRCTAVQPQHDHITGTLADVGIQHLHPAAARPWPFLVSSDGRFFLIRALVERGERERSRRAERPLTRCTSSAEREPKSQV
eukprot:SAG25_NODE_239_length_11223_cov_67.665049_6_plen_81_part_00